MTKVIFLSSNTYDEREKNYGDCIMIDTGSNVVVYDCGSKEHAERVLEYMKERGYNKIDVILSHNDADHFNGLDFLLENKAVKNVYTLLILRYIDDLIKEIDDKRRNRESIKKQIIELYDNIYNLSGKCNLKDAIEEKNVIPNVELVGPTKEYFINAITKHLNSEESDTINGETIFNATSIQVKVQLDNGILLLTGDAPFDAFNAKLKDYDFIQLPHHGKKDIADDIFEENDNPDTTYIVSDNTGNSNGGSDKLNTNGHIIQNTKYGDIEINRAQYIKSAGSLGKNI